MSCRFRNFATSLLSSFNSTINNGILNLKKETLTYNYFVQFILAINTTNYNVDVSLPVIRLKGSTEYVDG